MGHRLSRIVTRTGDDGTTGLGDGRRVGKDALRVRVLGDLDELNSALGCVLAEPLPGPVREALRTVQNDLFDLGGGVSIPGLAPLLEAQVLALDEAVAALNASLPPLEEFILPGGSRAGALCHLARTVCRRAERGLVALHAGEPLPAASLQYVNRLSDVLFVAARAINQAAGQPETQWRPGGAIAR
jgi:cob(I)alamin adenosyltransferase